MRHNLDSKQIAILCSSFPPTLIAGLGCSFACGGAARIRTNGMNPRRSRGASEDREIKIHVRSNYCYNLLLLLLSLELAYKAHTHLPDHHQS